MYARGEMVSKRSREIHLKWETEIEKYPIVIINSTQSKEKNQTITGKEASTGLAV